MRFNRAVQLFVGAILFLAPVGADAVITDARRSGMGGVLLPGRDLGAANPAWNGVDLPHTVRSIPIPLGLITGLNADTEGQGDVEAALTRLKSAYPFFEMELNPEPGLAQQIEIEVGQDYLVIDLGDAAAYVPDQAVNTDFLVYTGLLTVRPGPIYVSLSTILATEGGFDMDDEFREALQNSTSLDPNATYQTFMDVAGQFVVALEVGTTFKLGEVSLAEKAWGLHAGVGVKGLLGLAMAESDVVADMTTSDPILDATNPMDVTYLADLRYNDGVGWGAGFDLGLAAVQGPWFAGLSVENLLTRIHWNTEHRIEELTPDGDKNSITLATGEGVTRSLPVTWIANGGWADPIWMVAGDARLQQGRVGLHGGVERRFGFLAARTGASWSRAGGMQGAIGLGVGAGGWSFDMSIRSHPYLYSDGRGLFLGASLGLPL